MTYFENHPKVNVKGRKGERIREGMRERVNAFFNFVIHMAQT